MRKTTVLLSMFLLSLCSCGNNKSESIREADYEDRGDRDRDDDRDRDRDRRDRDRDDDDDDGRWW